MKCPSCGFVDSKVIDSRDISDGIRRRRQCEKCGYRFTTYEKLQLGGIYVIKKDQRREEFDKEKVLKGLRKACEKRPLPAGAIDKIADDIEAQLYSLGKREVPGYLIGDMVMEHLKELDNIAYIRFASVYRKFTDITELKEAVDKLAQNNSNPSYFNDGQLPLLAEDREVMEQTIIRRRKR